MTTNPNEIEAAVELLPCPNPWCEQDHRWSHQTLLRPEWAVVCGCGFMGPLRSSLGSAIAAWNTRSAASARGVADEGSVEAAARAIRDAGHVFADDRNYERIARVAVRAALSAAPSSPAATPEVERIARIIDPEWFDFPENLAALHSAIIANRQKEALTKADEIIALFRTPPAPAGEGAPIPMLLGCPKCGEQHIDEIESTLVWTGGSAPEPSHDEVTWNNPPHRSHLCHACGCIWRPADVATTGVATIETKGKADNWSGGACTCGGDTETPRDHHDISCPVAVPSPFSTGFIAGRDAAAAVADDNRTDDDSMWDRAAVAIAGAIRAIEPQETR